MIPDGCFSFKTIQISLLQLSNDHHLIGVCLSARRGKCSRSQCSNLSGSWFHWPRATRATRDVPSMTRVKSRRSAVALMCIALVAWEMKEMEMDSMDGASFVAPMVFHNAILSTPHSRFGKTWMEAKKSKNSKRSTPSTGFAKTKKAQLSEDFLPSHISVPSKTEVIQAYRSCFLKVFEKNGHPTKSHTKRFILKFATNHFFCWRFLFIWSFFPNLSG